MEISEEEFVERICRKYADISDFREGRFTIVTCINEFVDDLMEFQRFLIEEFKGIIRTDAVDFEVDWNKDLLDIYNTCIYFSAPDK